MSIGPLLDTSSTGIDPTLDSSRNGIGPFSKRINKTPSALRSNGRARCTDLVNGTLKNIPGNSREGQFLKAYEAELIAHVGGSPTFTERQLIIRAARLALHLQLWDEQSVPNGGAMNVASPHSHNQYVAWSNNLTKILSSLKVKAAPVRTHRTLAEIAEGYNK